MKLLKMAKVPPPVIHPDATVLDAVAVMAREQVGAVVMVGPRNEMKGIFTERDLMLRVVNARLDPQSTKVHEVMTATAKTATESVSALDAMNLMISFHLRHLPIVSEDGRVLGILSIRALLENKVEDLNRSLESMEQYMSNDGPGG